MKVHGYEITGQWHLEQVCDDGDYHHLYCDLTIKKPNSPHLGALLELLVTASIPKLNGHFDQVFKYEEQLNPREIWIVHFSREDSVVSDPYWPSEKLECSRRWRVSINHEMIGQSDFRIFFTELTFSGRIVKKKMSYLISAHTVLTDTHK